LGLLNSYNYNVAANSSTQLLTPAFAKPPQFISFSLAISTLYTAPLLFYTQHSSLQHAKSSCTYCLVVASNKADCFCAHWLLSLLVGDSLTTYLTQGLSMHVNTYRTESTAFSNTPSVPFVSVAMDMFTEPLPCNGQCKHATIGLISLL
jgi:hypothetical protein